MLSLSSLPRVTNEIHQTSREKPNNQYLNDASTAIPNYSDAKEMETEPIKKKSSKNHSNTTTHALPEPKANQHPRETCNELAKAIDRHHGPFITKLVNEVAQYGDAKIAEFLTHFSGHFTSRIDRLIQLAQQMKKENSYMVEKQIYDQISYLSTVALIESNLTKRNSIYKSINEKLLIEKKVMNYVAKIPFNRMRKDVMKPLGLLFGNISKNYFTQEERLNFKPLILKMLKYVTDSTVRYWYLLSLHRIVQEKNVTLEELDYFGLYEVMLESINSEKATTEVRYALKVITIFGGELYKAPCIKKFYEKGLMNYLFGFMKYSPKMVFNFLYKMHGTEFNTAFPDELSRYFLEVILYSHPINQIDHVKAALRITRYRLEDMLKPEYTVEQLDGVLLDSLSYGLSSRLCLIIRVAADLKQRHYAFNVVKDLILLVKARMSRIASLLIQSFLTDGIEDILIRFFSNNHGYKRYLTELNSHIKPEVDFRPTF